MHSRESSGSTTLRKFHSYKTCFLPAWGHKDSDKRDPQFTEAPVKEPQV